MTGLRQSAGDATIRGKQITCWRVIMIGRKSVLLLGLLALLLALTGCCCGGDTKTVETKIIEQPINDVALGDQLIKLKEAHDKGAITDKEYEDAKAKILKEK
jgi:hypothetical protein